MHIGQEWEKKSPRPQNKPPPEEPESREAAELPRNSVSNSSLYLVGQEFSGDTVSFTESSRRNSENLLEDSIEASTVDYAHESSLQSPNVSSHFTALSIGQHQLHGSAREQCVGDDKDESSSSHLRKSQQEKSMLSSGHNNRRNTSGKPPLKYHRIRKYDPNDESFQIQTGMTGKPPYSYATLIAVAIKRSPHGRLTLNGIYSWISDNFPYYRNGSTAWKNAVRHNLSLNRSFVRVARPISEPGRGAYWAVNPNAFAEHQASIGVNTSMVRKAGGPLSASVIPAKYSRGLNSSTPQSGPKSAPTNNVSSIVSSILQSTGVMSAPLTSGAEVMQVLAATSPLNGNGESHGSELAGNEQILVNHHGDVYAVPVDAQGQSGKGGSDRHVPSSRMLRGQKPYMPSSAVSIYQAPNPYFAYGQGLTPGFYGTPPSMYGYYATSGNGAAPAMVNNPNGLLDGSTSDFFALSGYQNLTSRLNGSEDQDYYNRVSAYGSGPVGAIPASNSGMVVDANGNQVNFFGNSNLLFENLNMRSTPYVNIAYAGQANSQAAMQQTQVYQQQQQHSRQKQPASSRSGVANHSLSGQVEKGQPSAQNANGYMQVNATGASYQGNQYSFTDQRRRESTESSLYWQGNMLDDSAAYANAYNQHASLKQPTQQALSVSQLTHPAPGGGGILSMLVQQPSYSSDIHFAVNQPSGYLSRSSSFAQSGNRAGGTHGPANKSSSSSNDSSSAGAGAFLETSSRSLPSSSSSASSLALSQSSAPHAAAKRLGAATLQQPPQNVIQSMRASGVYAGGDAGRSDGAYTAVSSQLANAREPEPDYAKSKSPESKHCKQLKSGNRISNSSAGNRREGYTSAVSYGLEPSV